MEQFEPRRLLVFDDIFEKDDLVDVVDTHHHRKSFQRLRFVFTTLILQFFLVLFFFFLVLKIIDPSMILWARLDRLF